MRRAAALSRSTTRPQTTRRRRRPTTRRRSERLSFAAGETTKTVAVTVNGDTLDEINETYFRQPHRTRRTRRSATAADSGRSPTTTHCPRSRSTTSRSPRAMPAPSTRRSPATLSQVSGRTVTVNYATANGSATSPADYPAASGTLSFAAGETTKTITVTVNGDILDEGDDTFAVNLSNAVGALVTDAQGIGTITDDDATPSLSINDVTVTEGNTGTVNATFTISLSAASGRTVTVDYATANGTATSPADYQARSGVAHLHAWPDDAAADRARQRRPARRGQRDVRPQPHGSDKRDPRRRPGWRHDHRRRHGADPLGQRRHCRRGQLGLGQRDLHRHALGPERPDGQRRPCDRGRDGDGRPRLHGHRRQPRSSTRESPPGR